MIWPHVTHHHPCPVCGKPDWCQMGDKAVKCMRIESDHACKSGGWYHFLDDIGVEKVVVVQPKAAKQPLPNAGAMIRKWMADTSEARLIALSESLGVLTRALVDLSACWAPRYNAWAFPMKDGYGETIGIRLRAMDGRKWAVTGSRQGVFLPGNINDGYAADLTYGRVFYICEGPTDTAAALSLGLPAIGRPSCNSGTDILKVALKQLHANRVVIVADRDPNGGMTPGAKGAMRLKQDLPYVSTVFIPPAKDIREFVIQGGDREDIEAELRNRLWTRGLMRSDL